VCKAVIIETTSTVTDNSFVSMVINPTNLKCLVHVAGLDVDDNVLLETVESFNCARNRVNQSYDLAISEDKFKSFFEEE
jgi:hypothetical protein